MPNVHVRIRDLMAGDGDAIARLMCQQTVLSREVAANLPTLLEQAIGRGCIIGAVIGDAATPSTIVGATLSCFVPSAFARACRRAGHLLLTSHLLHSLLPGQTPLMLGPREQALGNQADGLDLVVLDMPVAETDLAAQGYRELLHHVLTANLMLLRGFNVRSLMTEASVEFSPLIVGTGLREIVRARIDRAMAGLAFPAIRAEERALFAVTRDDMAALPPGSPASIIMTYVKPQFRFTPKEQKLLTLALRGHTDNSLAEALGVSANAVKQAWRNIYDHCQDVVPEIFGSTERGNGDSSRGAEKRRLLLVHIRDNLQELRPLHARRK